jgi:RHS repeat-associated protein
VTGATQLGTSGTAAACGQDVAATGFLTTYGYDALGNLTSSSQAGLSARAFTYDSLSRLISDANPEVGAITYAYDGDGNLTSRVAPKPNQTNPAVTVTTTYSYDQLDRLTSKSYSDGSTPSVAMTYDTQPANSPGTLAYPIGRLLEASVGNAITWISYDKMGRTAEEWQCTPLICGAGTYSFPYSYGPAGELLTAVIGPNTTISNTYDKAAQVISVTSSLQDSNHPSPLLSNASYNAPGQISALTLGNGLNENYNYDNRLRLTSMTAGTAYSLTMGYAPDSDVISAIDSANGSWTYSYDGFNRISASNMNSGSKAFTYAYDRYGNRWQQNVIAGSGPPLSVTFSGANNRVDGYTYDAAGNLMNDGSHSYAFDAENRIIQVDAGVTAAYVYDAMGQRAQKTSTGPTVNYFYDISGHQITEINSSETWDRMEIYIAGKHVATYSGGASGTTSFIHVDWLGTERVRTTVSGATGETCTSLPYGDALSCSGADVSPMHLTGKQRDTESNLDDFGTRYYTSTMGRWMTPDWSARHEAIPYVDLRNPQTLDLYAYVGNNPTTATDPDGHFWSPGDWFSAALNDASGGVQQPSTTSNDSNAPSTDPPDSAQNTGEGSEANLDRRAAIADTAMAHEGDTSMPYSPGHPTCKLFVQKDVAEAGAPKPEVTKADGSKGAPGAAEWAGSRVPGWRILGPNEKPERGDVAARKENFSDATGHSGIVTAVSKTGVVTVMAAHATKIGIDMTFQPNSQQFNNHFQRYTGD